MTLDRVDKCNSNAPCHSGSAWPLGFDLTVARRPKKMHPPPSADAPVRHQPEMELRRLGIVQAQCRQVEAMVAGAFGVGHGALRAPNRGRADVARARQVAMYLCNTFLGFTLTDVGDLFGRDRTTVAHACHVIEDLRDDRDFDILMTCLEKALNHHRGATMQQQGECASFPLVGSSEYADG